MKGAVFIIMLLGLLITGYLVVQDMKARQKDDSVQIQAIDKAEQVRKKVNKAAEDKAGKLNDLLEGN